MVTLTDSSFHKEVSESDHLWFVEFYAPWSALRRRLPLRSDLVPRRRGRVPCAPGSSAPRPPNPTPPARRCRPLAHRCGHCKSLKPAWADLARDLGGRVRVGAVDCTVEKQTCSEFGVQGFPSIKWFGARKEQPEVRAQAAVASGGLPRGLAGLCCSHTHTRISRL